MLPVIFIADLPDPASPAALGWLMAALAAAAIAANQVLAAYLNWKRLKGHDPDCDERYAAKAEIVSVSKDVAALNGRVDQINKTLTHELRDIHRALGRIEGALGTQN